MGRGLYTQKVKYGDNIYTQALEVRKYVLGKPLGIPFDERFTGDDKDAVLHAVVTWQGEVVSTAMLVRVDDDMVKMRQVATAVDMQGLGLGSRLMRYLEGYAAGKGYKRMRVPAQRAAETFYHKLGYLSNPEETYDEVGVAHIMMYRDL